jgi:thioredoxin 1
MKQELKFTDANFKKEVFDCKIPVLVEFWGSWCPPCKMVEPIIDELAVELDGKIKVGKINIDQNPKVRAMFNISGVPTFILFKKGKILKKVIGARSKQQLLDMIKETGIRLT